jgi:small subunit ribosomal protein S4
MGRYIGPKNKIARRFGVNLGLKSNPAKVARRLAQMPGVHGPKKRGGSNSTFGKQLSEKQKAKYVYGLREKQFRGYVTESNRREGDSGVNLQRILESRFDNVIYRLGFANTRAQARQMVGHNMFTLNGKKMNIPSHLVKVGDVITIKETKSKKKIFDGIEERLQSANLPSWVSVDPTKKSGKITNEPTEKDFDRVFDVKLIIEYYSTR